MDPLTAEYVSFYLHPRGADANLFLPKTLYGGIRTPAHSHSTPHQRRRRRQARPA
jgi:hypothetical protein